MEIWLVWLASRTFLYTGYCRRSERGTYLGTEFSVGRLQTKSSANKLYREHRGDAFVMIDTNSAYCTAPLVYSFKRARILHTHTKINVCLRPCMMTTSILPS